MVRGLDPLDVIRENAEAERRYNRTLSERYFSVWDEYPIQRYTNEYEQSVLRRFVPERSSVMVCGVGGGRELPVLLELGCSVVACDISEEMLDQGRQRYRDAPITWELANLNELPPATRRFDVVTALGAVVNYLLDPVETLTGLRRRTAADGRLVLASMNLAHASESGGRGRLADGRVRTPFTESELRDMAVSAGFTRVRISGYRFLVDLLPPEWNRNGDGPYRDVLGSALALEKLLEGSMPADRGKFLLLTARAEG